MGELNQNNIDRIIHFFNHGETWIIVIVVIAIAIGTMFVVYSCCFAGKKKPPLNYKDISPEFFD